MGAITSLFSKPKAPPPPAPPAVMPEQDDKAIEAARRARLQAQATRGGRRSTILTDDSLG